MRRVLKNDGALWVIGSYHNIYRVGAVLQNLGFWILNDVVWNKTNPMPNFRGTRFSNAHETLIWCVKNPEARYTFHYDAMKALNEGTQMRSDWTLPLCTGHERLKKDTGEKLHSTQKPEALLYRVVMATTDPGDVILDPFLAQGRRGLLRGVWGVSSLGLTRTRPIVRQLRPVLRLWNLYLLRIWWSLRPRAEPKVPFGTVVERGLLAPGAVLTDATGRFTAKVRADGTVISADARGSIHQVAAAVQGAATCNGWTFWYARYDGQLVPIDLFRQKVRAEIGFAIQ